MDELFCDVTDMVLAHVVATSTPALGSQKADRVFFNLSPPGRAPTDNDGFWYDPTSAPSLVLPAEETTSDAQYSPHLLAAAHLAAHIRQRIHLEHGFTTSAGIAHNKILAKLVASLNKPALQTTWNPDVRRYKEKSADFLGGF